MYQRRILSPDQAIVRHRPWLWLGAIRRRGLDTDAVNRLAAIAPTDTDILLTGPSTVQKECYAEFVHRNSSRGGAAFVSLNCAAVPQDRIASELFGDIDGTTNTLSTNGSGSEGPIAGAENGTLFLDEVQALPLVCQMRLLRLLQEKEYRRVGETHLRSANIRFVMATCSDLTLAARAGQFRNDLVLQLRTFSIERLSLPKRIVQSLCHLWSALLHPVSFFRRSPIQTLPATAAPV